MINQETRTAILRLAREGRGVKAIARALSIGKNTVKRVLASGTASPPVLERSTVLDPHLELVRETFVRCAGNRVRVHEELEDLGISVPYTTLTDFCRRHSIGVKPKQRAGRYSFEPGEEMQFDTSPHTVEVGGKSAKLQCASLTLCYSRMLFAQAFPTFNRFYAKIFLTDALAYFGGGARRCVIDNTSVVVAHGSGKTAVPAPEMEAFASRFGFRFLAHELGDKNRSARVERPFHYIEHNFYAGRSFSERRDLNGQFVVWCDRANAKVKEELRAKPIELFAAERSCLVPLPPFVPEVYALHTRGVDTEGYVRLHSNRYSTEATLIGREVEVHETKDRVKILYRHRVVTDHERVEDRAGLRVTLPEHRHGGRSPCKPNPLTPLPEETLLRAQGPEFACLVDALQSLYGGRATRALRRLHRLFLDYPTGALREVLAQAQRYRLTDLERIERMLLRHLSGDLFRLAPSDDEDDDE